MFSIYTIEGSGHCFWSRIVGGHVAVIWGGGGGGAGSPSVKKSVGSCYGIPNVSGLSGELRVLILFDMKLLSVSRLT